MAAQVQALLRFLSQDAKVPLATAMGKIKDLQSADLVDPATIAKSDVTKLQTIFGDDKIAKQTLSAAKRVAKKRDAGELSSPTTPKKPRFAIPGAPSSPAEIEASLELPVSNLDEAALSKVVVISNRAPLVLAFVVTLLKYTMPEQPLSSRLSLAQGYVSVTSRRRAVYLGIESGKSAEEEGFGKGQPFKTVMGHDIYIMRRWDYDWKANDTGSEDGNMGESKEEGGVAADHEPALWALDLEHLKKSNDVGSAAQGRTKSSALPVYTPQSARAYIAKAFSSPDTTDSKPTAKKKPSASAIAAEREMNLGHILSALDQVYASWSTVLEPAELDRRTWQWYVAVRPDVADGVAGWGGKNAIHVSKILGLRRQPDAKREDEIKPEAHDEVASRPCIKQEAGPP